MVSWRLLRYLPFIGRLGECSGKNLWDAFVEILIATVFATMPIWFLKVLGPVFLKAPRDSDAIRTGELFLFSAALVGPLIYIITKKYGERKDASEEGHQSLLSYTISFPYGAGFVFFSIGICFLSSFAFTVLRNPLFNQQQLSQIINYNGVISFSWWVFWTSLAVYYCATAYRNSIENIPERMRNDERAFNKAWRDRA